MIEEGARQGMSLQELLEFDSTTGDDQSTSQSRNFVQVVFAHVLSEANAPRQLADLVAHSLAERLDPALWEMLAPRIRPATLRQIMTVILLRSQAKTDDVESLRLKSESEPTRDELMLNAPTKKTTITA